MDTVATVSEEGTLCGLTGRTLTVPPSWPISSGDKVRLGRVVAWDLYPKSLIPRLKKERKRAFLIDNRAAQSHLVREVEKAHAKDDEKKVKELEGRLSEYVVIVCVCGVICFEWPYSVGQNVFVTSLMT